MNRRISWYEYTEWLARFYEVPSTHSIGFSFSSTFNLGQGDPELLSSREDEDILDYIQDTYVVPDTWPPREWPVYDEAKGG